MAGVAPSACAPEVVALAGALESTVAGEPGAAARRAAAVRPERVRERLSAREAGRPPVDKPVPLPLLLLLLLPLFCITPPTAARKLLPAAAGRGWERVVAGLPGRAASCRAVAMAARVEAAPACVSGRVESWEKVLERGSRAVSAMAGPEVGVEEVEEVEEVLFAAASMAEREVERVAATVEAAVSS